MRRKLIVTTHDCLTFTIGAISAIGIAVRHNLRNVGPILKDTGHFDRRIARRCFKAYATVAEYIR